MQLIQQSQPTQLTTQALRFPMFPAVLCIPTVGTLLMLFWLNSYLPDTVYHSSVILNLAFYGLDLLSYLRAILTLNTPLPAKPPKQGPLPAWINQAYRRDKRCQKQMEEQWKPPRTSHCHVCGCVMRMDHHCVWINQCVGARNHRAFLLFVLYSWLISVQFLILSLNYYLYHYQSMNYILTAIWTTWVGIGIILALSLGSMLGQQLYFMGSNMTQLQVMKFGGFHNPFRSQGQNIYNLGVIANFVDFFQADTFFWWWPKVRTLAFDGCDYIKLPAATRKDIMKLSPEQKATLKNPCEYSTFEEAVKAARQKYAGMQFSYNNELFKYDQQ